MITVLGSMLSSAADSSRLQLAIENLLAELRANDDEEKGDEYDVSHVDSSPSKGHVGSAVACSVKPCESHVTDASGSQSGGITPTGFQASSNTADCDELYDYSMPELEESSDEEDTTPAPRMPCAAAPPRAHRDKTPAHGWYNACVARPVKPMELKWNKKARDAMQVEWGRLRAVKPPDGTPGVSG